MKKRILILNWWDIKNPLAGGAEVHLDEIFSKLDKRNYEVTLLCARFKNCRVSETVNGIKVIRRGSAYTINLISFFWYLYHKDNFDFVIDYTNKIPYAIPLYIKKKPHLVITLDIFGRMLTEEFGILGYFLARFQKIILSFYKRETIVTISKGTKIELTRIGISSRNIRVIYPGVNLKFYKPGIKSKFPLIIYIGRLKKYKRVDWAILAFKKIADLNKRARLIIIGSGKDRARLAKVVKSNNLESNVSFLGFVGEKEKISWYQKAWLTIQPSVKEGWGLTVVEAGACGTPSIAANVCGLNESVINNRTGLLFEENSLLELEKDLFRLIFNSKEREKFSNQALQLARQFSWDKAAKELVEEIEKILKNRAKNEKMKKLV